MKELKPKELAQAKKLLQELNLPYPIADIGAVKSVRWQKPRSGQASFRWRGDVLCIEPIESSGRAAAAFQEHMLKTRIPAIAHELRHAQQWRDWSPLFFFLNNLPFVQNLKMEKEAYAVEDAARQQMGLEEGLNL